MKSFFLMSACSAFFLLAFSAPAQAASGRPIGKWDRLWADVDGIDPEVYVMMAEADRLMTDLTRAASIISKSEANDDKDALRSKLEENLRDRLTGDMLDLAGAGGAALPLNLLYTAASNGTKSWLDWGLRKQVARYYAAYTASLNKQGDPAEALKAADRWLDERLEEDANDRIGRAWLAMKGNLGFLRAYVYSTHKGYHPADYENIRPKAPPPQAPVQEVQLPSGAKLLPGHSEYPSGKPWAKWTYLVKDGRELKEGLYTEVYESGKKKFQATYKNGLQDGTATAWYENGQVNFIYQYGQGRLLSSENYSPEGRKY